MLALAIFLQTMSAPSATDWTLSRDAAQCTVQRSVGAGAARVTVGIQATPLESTYRLIVFYPAAVEAPARAGSIVVRSGPSSRSQSDTATSVADPSGRLLRASLPRPTLDAIGSDKVAFEPDREPAFALPVSDVESGLATLHDCEARIASNWGLDPTELADIATPAQPTTRGASLPDGGGLPPSASGSGGGTVVTLLTIEKSGRVSACRVVQSSGKEPLDRTTCEIFRKKIHYRAAKDSAGHAIRSWTTSRIEWNLTS